MKHRQSRAANSKSRIQGDALPTQAEVNAAVEVLHQGKYAELERLARAMTCKYERFAFGWKVLGIALKMMGRAAEALAPMQQSVRLDTTDADAYSNLGVTLKQLGRLEEAIATYRQAIALRPGLVDAYSNMGNALKDLERMAEAEVALRLSIRLRPEFAEAHHNLGLALIEQGRADQAEASFRRAISLKPNFADACNKLGAVLQVQGLAETARTCYRQAIALKSEHAEAHINLGGALRKLGRFAQAEMCYRRAIALQPDSAQAYNDLGVALQETDRLDEAEASYRRALAVKPGYAETRWALTISRLPAIFAIDEDPAAARRNFASELDKLCDWFGDREAKDGYKAVGSQQPFYLAYHEEDNKPLLQRYGALSHGLMAGWQARHGLVFRPAEAAGLIRVGIVSNHICDHSVWNALVKGWVRHLDRDQFELHIFYLGANSDAETEIARAGATAFIHGEVTLARWVEAILGQRLDVLIYPEIGMDAMTVKLANMRLAPRQVAAWGHPETTGLPTIDYYLSAEDFEGERAEECYSEQLVNLPHLGCCYEPAAVNPNFQGVAALGIDRTAPLLICAGAPFKYAPGHDRVLVEIARRLGNCRFVFFTLARYPNLSEALATRLGEVFRRAGLDFNDFGMFVPWLDKPTFYGLMQRADAYLDTIGFSGFNTAMQAVECGLPIVTREGRFMRGRLASGILKRFKLSELVAASDEDYASLVVKLVRDGTYRKTIKERMEASRQVLFGDLAPIRALEKFLGSICRTAA